MPSPDRRVVITGMGAITPFGNHYPDLWESISNGQSGIDLIQNVPMDYFESDFGGECTQFGNNIDGFGPLEKKLKRSIKKGLKLMCRDIQLGVAAAQRAIADSGYEPGTFDPDRFGTLFGSDYIITSPVEFTHAIRACQDENGEFDFSQWAEKGLPKVEPLWLLKYLPNMPASHVAIYNDLRGPSNSITVREASSNLAIAEATTIIRRGSADIMIAGSTGSRIHPLRTIHLALQEELANRHTDAAQGDPKKACRPFDIHRTGMVLGEGAGALVLETLESAEKRGAKIYGEVIGYGSTSVADRRGVPDSKQAFLNVIQSALETSGLTPDEIGHVHAHGLSSPETDREEAAAIGELLPNTPVTAAKSYMGNLGGGSGMIEAIASILSIEHQKHIPILNCDTPDPDCPIRIVTDSQESPGDSFINLNITPQGQASSIVIRAVA